MARVQWQQWYKGYVSFHSFFGTINQEFSEFMIFHALKNISWLVGKISGVSLKPKYHSGDVCYLGYTENNPCLLV